MLRSSVARIVSSSIGISYCRPVRLSVTVSVLLPGATPPPFEVCVSVLISLLSKKRGEGRPVGGDDPSLWPLYYPKVWADDTSGATGAPRRVSGSAAGQW